MDDTHQLALPRHPPRDEAPRAPERGATLLAVAGLCSCALALPILAVDFPPITDLPQHLAQVELFLRAIAGDDRYVIQWFTPYSLGYAPLLLLRIVLAPEAMPRAAMIFFACAWVAAAAWIAWRRGRPLAALPLVSFLFFNHVTYWGFLTFLFGWPLFLLWVDACTRERDEPAWRSALRLGILALLLFVAHALWYAMAMAYAGIAWLLRRPFAWRWLLLRGGAVLPAGILALAWYPKLTVGVFAKPAVWSTMPWERLTPVWLADAALGALKGTAEPILLLLIAGWLVVAVVQHRRELRARCDRPLLLAAALLIGAALVLPTSARNTIEFATRWFPFGLVALVLALPVPRFQPALLRIVAFAFLLAGVGATASGWRWIDEREQAGLAAALRAIPEGRSVLGLDFARQSEVIEGRPFMQQHGYAQAMRRADVNFSFAHFPPSFVIEGRTTFDVWDHPWKPGLEWFPKEVDGRDFAAFDFALIHGEPATHAFAERLGFLDPLTGTGTWRTYRIDGPRLADRIARYGIDLVPASDREAADPDRLLADERPNE